MGGRVPSNHGPYNWVSCAYSLQWDILYPRLLDANSRSSPTNQSMSDRAIDVFAVQGLSPVTRPNDRDPIRLEGTSRTGVKMQYASAIDPFSVESVKHSGRSRKERNLDDTVNDEREQSTPSWRDRFKGCLFYILPPCISKYFPDQFFYSYSRIARDETECNKIEGS